VADKIAVTGLCFFGDELSIKDDKSAENEESEVELHVKDSLGVNEQVDDGGEEEERETAGDKATNVQEAAAGRKEGGGAEAAKNTSSSKKSSGDDGWVNVDNLVQKGSEGSTLEETKSKEKEEPLANLLLGGDLSPDQKPKHRDSAKESSELASYKVRERSKGSNEDGHGKCGVNASEVLAGSGRYVRELAQGIEIDGLAESGIHFLLSIYQGVTV